MCKGSIGEKPRSKGLKFIFRGIDAPFPEPEITVGHRAFSDQITVCPTKCSIGRARARARLDQTIMRSLLVAVTIESEPPQKFRVSELNMAEILVFIYLALPTRAGSPQQHMPITVGPFT
jgi:hypothetical protein